MIKVQLSNEFLGPNILELAPVLDNIQGVIEVFWENSKAEIHTLKQHPDRSFILMCRDVALAERTAATLGVSFQLDVKIVEEGLTALLSRKNYNWRPFSEEVGTSTTGCVVTKLTANNIRSGGRPKLAPIAADIIHAGVNPVDADVLLRIRAMRGH